jgi:hypothetical protein
MTARSVFGVLFVVTILAISAIELSTWALARFVSAIVPAASITEVNAEVSSVPEVEVPAPTVAPVQTW